MPRVRVLAPWQDSVEIVHRSGTIDGVPRPRRIEIRASTGSYVRVRCEKGQQQRSATSLRCTKSWKLHRTKTEVDFVCCMCICVHVRQQLCYTK